MNDNRLRAMEAAWVEMGQALLRLDAEAPGSTASLHLSLAQEVLAQEIAALQGAAAA